jgi:hypothetical protein
MEVSEDRLLFIRFNASGILLFIDRLCAFEWTVS